MRLATHPLVRVAVPALGLAVGIIGAAATSRALADRPTEAPPADVVALRETEVRQIALESTDARVTLARTADGRWTGVAGATAETEGLMADVRGNLFPLQAYRSLPGDPTGSEYGLTEPEIVLRIVDVRGREHRVDLGAPTFTNGGVYARRNGDPGHLYLVPRRTMDDLRSLLAGRRIDTPNDIPEKLKEKTPRHDPTSWWLRQIIEAEEQP